MSDHGRVTIQQLSLSCGVLGLSGFSSDATVEDISFQLASYLYHPAKGTPAEFVVFSDTPNSKGHDVSKYLLVFGGILVESPWAENSKTGNLIKVFTWQIPHTQFKEWYQNERISRIKKQQHNVPRP